MLLLMKFWTFLRHRIIVYSFNFYFVCYFKLLLHVILFSKFLRKGGVNSIWERGKSQGAPPLYETLMRYTSWLESCSTLTTYKELIELQVLNGDKLLEKHLSEGPSNAQYTSRFSARVLIEAIDIWIERKLMCSLQEESLLFHLSR